MDTISVKSCAPVADMRQKLGNTTFKHGSQLACKANYWTAYLSLGRAERLANHSKTSVHFYPKGLLQAGKAMFHYDI